MTDAPAFDAKVLLGAIAGGRHLTEDEMFDGLDRMTAGEATPAQMGAFLMGLRVRGETVAELAGAQDLQRLDMRGIRRGRRGIDHSQARQSVGVVAVGRVRCADGARRQDRPDGG
jgi:anthranilate phosphoribosyltransferase